MSPIRKQLDEMIDCLSEQEQILLLVLFEIVKRFAPDIATADDLAAIRTAREEYARDETVGHEKMNRDQKADIIRKIEL